MQRNTEKVPAPNQEKRPTTAFELLMACERILEEYVQEMVGLSIDCFIEKEQVVLRFWKNYGMVDEKTLFEINKIINRLNNKELHPTNHTAEKIGKEVGHVPDVRFQVKQRKERKKKPDTPSPH